MKSDSDAPLCSVGKEAHELFGNDAILSSKGVTPRLLFVGHLKSEGLKHTLVRILVIVVVGRRDDDERSVCRVFECSCL